MTKFNKLVFMNSLILGTLMALSSYSWLSMWMGLEINLLSIIPLMMNPKNVFPSESAMKYFITQAMASMILLFTIIVSFNTADYIFFNSISLMTIALNSSLLMKMGAAPFHFWFPEVMEGLNWLNNLLMMTWQKIAPMVLLNFSFNQIYFLTFIIVLSSLISGLMSLNQTSLRKILAYSSINHISWMISAMMYSNTVWLIYFIVYSIISINLILILKNLNSFYLTQLFFFFKNNKSIKILVNFNFFSLGGLPPFLGFFPKWLTINYLTYNNFYFLTVLMILFNMMMLFAYLRITFSSLTIKSNESTNLNYNLSFTTIFLNYLTIFLLVMMVLIFNLF
uniref:NADH-ubiquinone oxidoreductase chain 2 n=1 Tax=Aulacochilus grouvellei TaxID=2800504 RepID=A0A7T7BXN1_9CUCU|nr:NADH dehydrogenase subunit 2 [Aulacochilus grouvellei]QQK56312.1 NADH dehydrogenase subunit 2 [Aulacochilus grouvellei]